MRPACERETRLNPLRDERERVQVQTTTIHNRDGYSALVQRRKLEGPDVMATFTRRKSLPLNSPRCFGRALAGDTISQLNEAR